LGFPALSVFRLSYFCPVDDAFFASCIMPNPIPKLAFSFAVASPRGTDFFDSIDPPGKSATLHATLLDGSNKIPAMGDISSSFGHQNSKSIHTALGGTGDFLSVPKRIEYGIRGFDELNDSKVVGLARLQLLQDFPVGAVLLVSSGGGTVPYITVLANPTITPVDPTSPTSSGGAPLWEETFESILRQQYVTAANTPTRGVLSSGSWKTRAGNSNTRAEFCSCSQYSHPWSAQLGKLANSMSWTR
jgi:hypothetical protein